MAVFDDLVAAANPTIIRRNLDRLQGASWEVRQYLSVNGTAVDWTGCTATCQIRDKGGALIFSFASITADSSGWVTLKAAPSETSPLAAGTYDYDVDIVNSASRRLSFMAGTFRISKQVTQ